MCSIWKKDHNDHFQYCWESVQFPWFCLVTTKFEVMDGPVLQLLDGLVLQLHVTAQFCLQSKGKYILGVWGNADPKDVKREPLAQFSLLFLCFFSLLLGLPHVNWASPECCLFYLRSSLRSSDLPMFYFGRLFPPLSFSHHHFGLPFRILTTYHPPLKDGRPNSLGIGVEVSLTTSCWTGMVRGIEPPPLASLKLRVLRVVSI